MKVTNKIKLLLFNLLLLNIIFLCILYMYLKILIEEEDVVTDNFLYT